MMFHDIKVPVTVLTCIVYSVYILFLKIDFYKVSGRGKGACTNSLLGKYVLSYDVSFMAIHKNICYIVMLLFCHRT